MGINDSEGSYDERGELARSEMGKMQRANRAQDTGFGRRFNPQTVHDLSYTNLGADQTQILTCGLISEMPWGHKGVTREAMREGCCARWVNGRLLFTNHPKPLQPRQIDSGLYVDVPSLERGIAV
jgi:hypothetical protein